uniref:Uncharacterized protein n=2 Tax=Trichobilharzia regenti TaxID=157069 RepID=A0AA85J6K2_TRIRE|nr:unnamed protein product [Trichobilharzia regenti]
MKSRNRSLNKQPAYTHSGASSIRSHFAECMLGHIRQVLYPLVNNFLNSDNNHENFGGGNEIDSNNNNNNSNSNTRHGIWSFQIGNGR